MAKVILVDKDDNQTGVMDKLEAHKKGVLHRAFSIFLFNDQKELLLQKRAEDKYHSGGLWTNTCCSHPSPGEFLIKSANKRLVEEMGIATSLTQLFAFTYKTGFGNGLTEHEYDHVLIGNFNASPAPSPNEVCDWRYESFETIKHEIDENPDNYTYWFREIYERVFNYVLAQ